MSKKQKQFTTYKEIGSAENGFKVEKKPIFPTNPDRLCKQIHSYLNGNDLDMLSELLSSDFIYPGVLKKTVREVDQLEEEQETYLVRPFLEALFYEYQALFYQLLSRMIESKNTPIFEVFIKHFEKTSIPKTITSPWKESTLQNVKSGIIDMDQYGKKIKTISDKGFEAIALSRNLSLLVKAKPEEKENIYKSKIEWLHFKLKFLRELHKKDAAFAGHRGCKKFIANLASLVFSGCLLNGINYCFTGNWWFCHKTTTEQKVHKLHKIVNNDNGVGYAIRR